MCLTGFLYATLEPTTAAFKKRASALPFGENSEQRSLLAEMRFLSGPQKGRREDIPSPQQNTLSEACSRGILQAGFVQASSPC